MITTTHYDADKKAWISVDKADPTSAFSRPATPEEIAKAEAAPPAEKKVDEDVTEVDGKRFRMRRVDASTVVGEAIADPAPAKPVATPAPRPAAARAKPVKKSAKKATRKR